MKINLIWAQDPNGLIGINLKETKEFKLPWVFNDKPNKDLRYFKSVTFHHAVVMGHNTWLSLNRKPLKQRINIILTKNNYQETVDYVNQLAYDDVYVCRNKQEVLNVYKQLLEEDNLLELFVIGGASLYYLFKEDANRFYQTIIHEYESYYKDCSMYDKVYLTGMIDTNNCTLYERTIQYPFEWLVYH